jgi:uncharacterized protein YndB with AHSA1/START domain
VFAAVQDPVRLARWWGPAGFTNTFHAFDFREDGPWLFSMHGPDGTTYPNEARFVEIVPNERVAIRHISAPRYDLVITLEPTTAGTLVSWHCVFENSAFVENARQFLETANAQNLERLAAEAERA